MENKTKDMFLATMYNPSAKTYDFLNNDVTPSNTRLLSKDFYENQDIVKERFLTDDGKFDKVNFDNFYNLALHNYNLLSDEKTIEKLNTVEYDPFDKTKPVGKPTFEVDVKFSKDVNPFKQLYSREYVNSITESKYSLREIAQKGKVYDWNTGKWLESANKRSLFSKFFGDTLVYAQWDEDGTHIDPITNNTVNHSKGDWKFDDNGDLHIETIGNREIYGKMVVSPTDILTTDGTLLNKFDFFDSDGRKKSIGKATVKTIVEIAPLLIPFTAPTYAGIRAAIGLASVLPTFYKSFEGILLGDEAGMLRDPITTAENWMAKFNQNSTSDKGSESLFNYEQLSSMVGMIFGQIHEQRAVASLSKMLVRPDKLMNKEQALLQLKAAMQIESAVARHGINANKTYQSILAASPTLQQSYKLQSQVSKALSLGYMALTSTSDIYGQALEGGFDRRTAGFSSLMAAGAQYGVMMNSQMADWFLDKTTGYNVNVNKSLMSKSIKPLMKETSDIFNNSELTIAAKRAKLANINAKFRQNVSKFFSQPAVAGEAILKNALVEGVEEVTEELAEDAIKGIVDVMSYLGLTKSSGSFRTVERFKEGEAFQEYLANFVGGLLGGGMFEIERSKMSSWFKNAQITTDTHKDLVELIMAGHKQDLLDAVKREARLYGDTDLSFLQENGEFKPAETISQADLLVEKVSGIIEDLDTVLNSEGINLTDDEIINKAIRNQIIVSKLEGSRQEGKYTGVEALVLEDFKTAATEVARLKAKIMQLEKNPNSNEGQIKRDKQELKKYTDKVNNILSGDYGMKYFNQLAFYLNPDRDKFGSLTLEDYVKAKHKINYSDLPDSGLGLTKSEAVKEWNDFISSVDVRYKLETMTNAYLELEKTLNVPIGNYVNSGYIDLRHEVFNKIIDLKTTFDLFNITNDEKVKTEAIERFVNINKELEKLNIPNFLPGDIYNSNLVQELIKLNLIQNLDGSKVTDIEKAKTYFDSLIKYFPTNPLSLDLITKELKTVIENNNESIDLHIARINDSDLSNEEKVKAIAELESSKSEFKVNEYLDIADRTELIKEYSDILQNNNLNEVSKQIDEFRYEFEKDLDAVKPFVNSDDTVKSIVDLTSAENIDSYRSLSNDTKDEKLVELVKTKAINYISDNASIDDFDAKFETYINAIKNDLDVDSDFENELFDLLVNTVETMNAKVTSLNEKYSKIKKINEADKRFIEKTNKNKPEMLNVQNYTFNLLLEALKTFPDRELYLEVEKMFKIDRASLNNLISPKDVVLNDEIMNIIINDVDGVLEAISELVEEVKDFESPYYFLGEESDITMSEVKAQQKQDAINYPDSLVFKDIIYDLLKNITQEDVSIHKAWVILDSLYDQVHAQKSRITNLKKFMDLGNLNLKTNPIYDMLRGFSLTLNSNPNSKEMKILEILEKEERSFKAASSISEYLSDGIRKQDLKQASDLIKLFKTVVNSMSTTTYFDSDEDSGFIAMRQLFAKKNNLQDDILNLNTISSDHAAIINKDLSRLDNRLDFLMNLSEYNSKKIAAEEELTRDQITRVNLDLWRNLIIDNPEISVYIPTGLVNVLSSNASDESKLIEIESLFFEHNKNNKIEAIDSILSLIRTTNADGTVQTIDSSKNTKINKDTTYGQLSNYSKAIYFATVLSTRADDYYRRQLMSLEGQLNKAPFYTQEYSARVVISNITNPEVFLRLFENQDRGHRITAPHLMLIVGGAGVGKTTTIIGQSLDIIRQTNKLSKIWLSAPSSKISNKLYKDVTDSIGVEGFNFEVFSKNKLFSKNFGEYISKLHETVTSELKNPNSSENKHIKVINGEIRWDMSEDLISEIKSNIPYEDLPNAIVMDEVTHYSTPELQLLNAISAATLENGTYMKIIGAGDFTQLGYKVKAENQQIEYNINNLDAVFTPYLTRSIRSANEQSRFNFDMMLGISSKAIDIYNNSNHDVNKANSALVEYLNDINTETSLQYHLSDDSFFGHYIANDYSDLKTLFTIKNILDKDSSKDLSILTSNGELTPSLKKALSDVGFTLDQIKSFDIYSPDTVQGSESDYFIFDTSAIDPTFDKLKDTMRAYYTYATRGKSGVVIFDQSNVSSDKLNIVNANNSSHPLVYDPITGLIKSLKEERINKLKGLLSSLDIVSDGFVWQVNKEAKEIKQLNALKFPSLKIFNPNTNTVLESNENTNRKFKKDEFGPMLHSFYNNPNAIITTDDNKNVTKIEVDHKWHKFDLNGIDNIEDPNVAKSVFNDWANLRYWLLWNNTGTISTTKYSDYFNHIFGEDSGNISIRIVKVAHKFNNTYNSPVAKEGNDPSKHISSDTEPMVNMMAELTFGDKVQYITLATFPAVSTLKKAIDTNLDEKDSVKEDLKDQIDNFISDLNDRLTDENSYLVLNEISDVKTITSTRLLDLKDGDKNITHNLSDLNAKFPGLKVSEIRRFPSDFKTFEELLNKYKFNGSRSKEEIENFYKMQKGKAYIVVTYDNSGFEGDVNSDNVIAKIIPVSANSRKLNVLRQEISDLSKEWSNFEHNDKVPDLINAKSEMILGASQILDMLVKWSTSSDIEFKDANGDVKFGKQIDLLTSEYELSNSGGTISLLSVLDRFRRNYKGVENLSTTGLRQVINFIKERVEKGEPINTLKENVIKDIDDNKIRLWSSNFYVLFDHLNVISSKQGKDFNNVLQDWMVDEDSLIKEEEYDLIRDRAIILINTLKNIDFYYSIPIKSDKGQLIINPEISGINGFSTNIYSDKLKINRTPEAPRLIMSMDQYLNNDVTIKGETKEVIKPVVSSEPELEPEKISKDLRTRLNYFGELSKNIKNIIDENPGGIKDNLILTIQNATLNKLDNKAKVLGDILINSGIDIGWDASISMLTYPEGDTFNTDTINDLIDSINDILCT